MVNKIFDAYGTVFEKIGKAIGADKNPISATISEMISKPAEGTLFLLWVAGEMGIVR